MTMIKKTAMMAVVAGLAMPAMAQDSVSSNGLGDALSPYDATEVSNQYVADLVSFTTSWGTEFGIVPIIKGTDVSPTFFNNLLSSQALSSQLANGVAGGGSFDLWTTAGAGIDGTNNTAPGSTTAPAMVSQFGLAAADFGTTAMGTSYNGVIGAKVQYDPNVPTRLYVNRNHIATNGGMDGVDSSQFGGMSVDSDGDTFFRADNFAAGPNTIAGNNIFRVDLDGRGAGLNVIDVAGASDAAASARIINASATTTSPSNLIPASITGGNAIMAGGNFSTQYVSGDVGSVSFTGAHLDTSAGGSAGSDQRGTVAGTDAFLLGSADYTLGILSRDVADDTRAINIWGVDATGAVVAGTPANLIFPGAGTMDNFDGSSLAYNGESIHHNSQTAFRGGVSQVALGSNAAGTHGLAAFTVADEVSGPANDEWINSIVVAKFDPADPVGTQQWAVVAYCNDSGLGGKAITDGAGGTVGQLVPLIDFGAASLGPSISSPSIDSAGNVWFVATAELFKVDSMGNPFSDFDSVLIRAVYDEANFAWELELVLEVGDVFTGANSGTEYQLSFMGQTDSNSISSGASYSNNTVQDAFGGADPADFDTSDPRTNGGVVVNASITYDSNGDGDFDVTMGDERYGVLLYVGNTTELPADACPADQNGDGNFNNTDINLFVGNFLAMNPAADINMDGNFNNTDINLFVSLFLTQCQ